MTAEELFATLRHHRPDISDAYDVAVAMLVVAFNGNDHIHDGLAAGRAFARLCAIAENVDGEPLPEEARRWLLDKITQEAKVRALDANRKRAN